MPIGSDGIAAVDVRDIAEAVAISLTEDGHVGKTYNLAGPAVAVPFETAALDRSPRVPLAALAPEGVMDEIFQRIVRVARRRPVRIQVHKGIGITEGET